MISTTTVTISDLREVVAVAVERHPEARRRIEKGAAIVLLRSIDPDPEYAYCFRVESESEPGRFYSVDISVGVCECRDHQRRGIKCGHLWSVRLLEALHRLRRVALVEAA